MQKNDYIRYSVLFVILVLSQVLILNNISFLGYAIPFIYIYFIIKLPIGSNRNIVILLGFLLGFIIDIFCNTPGMNAAATTLIAFLSRPAQGLFFIVDDYNEQSPRLSLLGGAFMKYAIFMVMIHHVVLISLESFSYINITLVFLRIISSTILTSVLIFAFEGFSIKKERG